jgi:hypothetical protein
MKKILILSIGFIFAFLTSTPSQTHIINGREYFLQDSIWYVINSETGEEFVVDTNSITVKLKNSINHPNLENIINNLGISIKRENILGYIDIYIPPVLNVFEICQTLLNTNLFESVEINSFGEILFNPPPTQIPNDTYFGEQYYLNHATYPDINAPEGWDLCINFGEGVLIAILDNGFDYEHPDLIDNAWPDVGWDFVDGKSILENHRKGDHGTEVAGISSASSNNGLGISGIAGGWAPTNSGAKIMSVVMVNLVILNNDIIDDAIIYSVENGAKILNMSWYTDASSSINAALDYAYNQGGCLLVAAAGNDYNQLVVYPARNYNVIAVSGIIKNWDHYGNTGYQIELTAPAEAIYTTLYSRHQGDPYYGIPGSGTSASSPMVSAAAALLWSNYPSLTNFDIRRILKETASSNFTTYNELYFGEGLLKIDAALLYIPNMPNKPSGVSISAPIEGHPTITWNAVSGADYYKVYRSEPNLKMLLNTITTTSNTSYTDQSITVVHPKFAPVTYYYRVTAVDNGYESPVSSEVSCGSNTVEKIYENNFAENTNKFELFNNYPNPFNPSTKINYQIGKESFVQLKVYDVLGSEVVNLVNTIKTAGKYEVEFNAKGLSSGVYFYTLTANDYYKAKKMILLP